MGGPGAIFWMWISALLGVSTKFFTCSLAVMYRGKDSAGEKQGGTMYFITEGLGKKWKPLAIFFSVMAMFGVLPIFQANQLTEAISNSIFVHNGMASSFTKNLVIGMFLASIVALVILGGVKRIGKVTGRMVPIMAAVYIVTVLYIIMSNASEILPSLQLIFMDAFSGKAVLGGSFGAVILMGVRRAAFSNEAGIGTATMAHGAAKTNEPIREGLVAMLGPIIDTIIICTMTALAIIITGVWKHTDADGITLTAEAFDQVIPFGSYLLTICVSFFALSTMFAYPYYGSKSLGFVVGAKYQHWYHYAVVVLVVVGAVAELDVIVSFCDLTFALMAFPTMISAILLSGKVRVAALDYFRRYKAGAFD
ncbi:MAG TPA: alanine/glycine:cation symporter family protein, partial [Sunxiuqinia sp.]|nr:alanine/glycine:cation symporter family protein [Sunxiuqinia sp.]